MPASMCSARPRRRRYRLHPITRSSTWTTSSLLRTLDGSAWARQRIEQVTKNIIAFAEGAPINQV